MSSLESFERWIAWPEWAKDAVVTDVRIRFDWKDRLLILIGQPVTVTTKAHTENVAGKTEGKSHVTVDQIRWPWSRRPGFAVTEVPAADSHDAEGGR